MEFLDEAQEKELGKTFFDFSKIVMAAGFASEFFVKFTTLARIAIFVAFMFCLIFGTYLNKKEEK